MSRSSEYYAAHLDKMRQQARARYARRRDVLLARQKEWYLNNQDKVKKYRSSKHYRELTRIQNRKRMSIIKDWSLQKNFGISLDEYKDLLLNQKGKCAICKKPEKHISRWGTLSGLSVDHCHKTKKVRGLLCRRCNTVIGMFGDNPDLLESSSAYLRGD